MSIRPVRPARIAEKPIRAQQIESPGCDTVSKRPGEVDRVREHVAEPAVQQERLARADVPERNRLADPVRAAGRDPHQGQVPQEQGRERRASQQVWPPLKNACDDADRHAQAERRERHEAVEAPHAEASASPPVVDRAVDPRHGREEREPSPGRHPILPRQREQAGDRWYEDRRPREQAVARGPEDIDDLGIQPGHHRPHRRSGKPVAVDGVPGEHLRQEPDRRTERQQGSRARRTPWLHAQPPQEIHCRQGEHQDVLPPHDRHDAAGQAQREPSRRRPSVASRAPAPQEAGDRRHRHRVRHGRLAYEVPQHERPGRGQHHRRDGLGRSTKEPDEPVGEPEAEKSVEQPRDDDGLAVRVGGADGIDRLAPRRQVTRNEMADGEEGRPSESGADGPRALRVSRHRRLEQKLMRPVVQAQEPIVVGEIHVAVERQGAEIGVIVEAVALEPRAEPGLRHQSGRHRRDEHQRGRGASRTAGRGDADDRAREDARQHGGRCEVAVEEREAQQSASRHQAQGEIECAGQRQREGSGSDSVSDGHRRPRS